MEIAIGIVVYYIIGMILALTPRLPDNYESSMVVIVMMFVVIAWPVYVLLKIVGWIHAKS